MNFEENLCEAEKRLNIQLPEEYKEFIKNHAGNIYVKGEWLIPQDLETGDVWGLKTFESFKLINSKDLNLLIPIFNNIKDREMIILDYRSKTIVEVLIVQEKTFKYTKFDTFYNLIRYIEQQEKNYIN